MSLHELGSPAPIQCLASHTSGVVMELLSSLLSKCCEIEWSYGNLCHHLIFCMHCAAPYWDLGCQGGDFFGGMKYIIDNGGIALESEYPYLARDDKCQRKLEHDRVRLDSNLRT